MKKVLLLVAVSAFALYTNNSFADEKTQTANVKATIVGAGSITKTVDMNFGTIVSDTKEQTAKLTPNGDLSGVASASGESVTAAEFTITGDEGLKYTLSVSEATLSDGTNTMSLENLSMLVDGNAYSQATNAITNGSDIVNVGGDLKIGANQASGVYTGEITLTMTY